jgi:chorismate dehydratase
MLRDGEIDVSPSSSIEYLKNPSLYQTIDSHSISSKGPVESILFFSKKPIENLSDSTIYVSSQSETSIALLDIILKKFYGVQCVLQISENPESSGGDAWLLIGDDALRYGSRFTAHDSRLIYDLGKLWHEKTGLPFVFALWIVRKDIEHSPPHPPQAEEQSASGGTEYRHNLLDKFVKDLNMAKNIALKNLSKIAKHSPMKSFMSEEEIISYWNKIDYDFAAEHKKGLEIFYQYLKELSYF